MCIKWTEEEHFSNHWARVTICRILVLSETQQMLYNYIFLFLGFFFFFFLLTFDSFQKEKKTTKHWFLLIPYMLNKINSNFCFSHYWLKDFSLYSCDFSVYTQFPTCFPTWESEILATTYFKQARSHLPFSPPTIWFFFFFETGYTRILFFHWTFQQNAPPPGRGERQQFMWGNNSRSTECKSSQE